MEPNQKNKRGILWILVTVGVILIDQLTKYLAVQLLKPIDTFPIIPDVLHLTYTTNKGAAFGMLQNHRWVFLAVSTAAIVLLGWYLWEKRDGHPLLCTALAFIVGGGIGNMIDRTLLGYVVDFIDFRLIHFAIFNGADSFVCVGCGMVFLWLFLYGEDEDGSRKKKEKDVTEAKKDGTDDASDR